MTGFVAGTGDASNVGMSSTSTDSNFRDGSVDPNPVIVAVCVASPLSHFQATCYARDFADMLGSLELDIACCVSNISLSDSDIHLGDVMERLYSRERLVRFGMQRLLLTEAQIAQIVADALLGTV